MALGRKKQPLSTDRILKAGIKISTTMVIIKFVFEAYLFQSSFIKM